MLDVLLDGARAPLHRIPLQARNITILKQVFFEK
jgi:hypothetical protein